MTSLRWIAATTETLFDLGWMCGSVEHTDDDAAATQKLDEKLKRVWSGLEYEPQTWDYEDDVDQDDDDDDTLDTTPDTPNSRTKSLVDDDEEEEDEELGGEETADRSSSTGRAMRACHEPQERGSNIPVLRQLPSFGSTLASNSLHSGHSPSGFSYQRSTSSTQSNRFVLKPQETPVVVKASFPMPSSSQSYIFLQQ